MLKNSIHIRKWWRKYKIFFRKKTFLLSTFQEAHRMDFRQPYCQIFTRRLKTFRSISEIDKQKNFLEKTSFRQFDPFGHKEHPFDLLTDLGKISTIIHWFFAQFQKLVRKIIFPKKFFLLRMFPWTSSMQFWQFGGEKFRIKAKQISLHVQKRQRSFNFFSKILFFCSMFQ